MKKEYTGRNGEPLAIDLSRIEAVQPEDDGTRLMVGEYWYTVLDPYTTVRDDWIGSDGPPKPALTPVPGSPPRPTR